MFDGLNIYLGKFFRNLKREVLKNPKVYILLGILVSASLFVRVYRLDQLLGFYYDQGRDAKVIWNLWKNGKPFLIGPVTGLAGIFLGPFYYYLIAPFYILGGGDPVWPATFLALMSTLAVVVTYYLGWKFESRITGIIAALVTGFSYYLVLAGRWLSNPTPILLTSILLFWSLWEIINDSDRRWWIVVSLVVGLSLHFESASAVFYIPVVLAILAWRLMRSPTNTSLQVDRNAVIAFFKEGFGGYSKRIVKEFGSSRILWTSLLVLFLTLLPQLLFNFRHENILLNNFIDLFTKKKSFSVDIGAVMGRRLNYFWSVYSSKILVGKPHYAAFFTAFSFAAILYHLRSLVRKKIMQLFTFFLFIPAIGYILFQGNYGNIYDYYLTGYYNIFVLLFALGLGLLWRNKLGRIVVLVYTLIFLQINIPLVRNYLRAGVDGPTHISLGNELQAVDWILDDSKNRGVFNTSFYVPPVIPHTYEYLMTWQANSRCGEDLCGWERTEEKELVYVLFEKDPPHPERLEKWLNDRKNNTEVLKEQVFGGITVQRRKRL